MLPLTQRVTFGMRPLHLIERRYQPRVAFWKAQNDDSWGIFQVSRLCSCRITITTNARRQSEAARSLGRKPDRKCERHAAPKLTVGLPLMVFARRAAMTLPASCRASPRQNAQPAAGDRRCFRLPLSHGGFWRSINGTYTRDRETCGGNGRLHLQAASIEDGQPLNCVIQDD